eukprot:9470557-Pyramimonas_sp.AAC.1
MDERCRAEPSQAEVGPCPVLPVNDVAHVLRKSSKAAGLHQVQRLVSGRAAAPTQVFDAV